MSESVSCLLYPILCDPINCRLLYPWYSSGENTGVGCIPFSQASFQPRDQAQVSCITDGSFTVWATRETRSMYVNQRPAMVDLHVLLLTVQIEIFFSVLFIFLLLFHFLLEKVLVLINIFMSSVSSFINYNSWLCCVVLSRSVISDSLWPQARILEWVVTPSSRESSQARDQTQVSHIAGGFLTV